ncbi:glycosyl hydrolase [Paenibacillus sp. Marseille-Q4541]|uniref:glycosyl hydrolase n=1 Tax=Paenibacillus sp. Marseille-Q4541 TaxID=2831522 RepID=UPI001BAA2C69|nr:glycosyl hydrolase [Paenibacillus sp. Marseille-Q4541]
MWNAETFQNPGNEYRVHPFWFWNGEMDDEQIRHQIDEMAKQGVGGFFICARQGLTIPYLSQSWFDKVRFAVQEAKSKGMQVWLYDEYPYPSGMAGGEVTLEMPEAKQRMLVHHSGKVSHGESVSWTLPWAVILYAKAVPISTDGKHQWDKAIELRKQIGNVQLDQIYQETGLTSYNRKRFFTYETAFCLEWAVPEGNYEIFIFMEQEIDDFKYYGNFVDPLNEKAMKRFIQLTHERYQEELGEDFGTVIKGMFTDEIAPLGRIPWSPQLPSFFKESMGYDLLEQLPALLRSDVPQAKQTRYDFFQSVHLLLRKSVHKQAHDFCEQAGIQYAAEVPSLRMTTQLYSHLPGGDSAHEKTGRSLAYILERYGLNMRDNPKMVSSLARQLGRPRNMIECFHSVGWSMTLQDAKWMIDRMAALGTNFYNFHAFFYTIGGLAKHDAPPSQFLQNPYWPYFRQLGDYVGRISYLMSEGRADIRIALLDPTTTFWTLMGNPLHGFQYGGEVEKERQLLDQLKSDWLALSNQLLRYRRDYDHLDPELLAEAQIEDGKIAIGTASYEVLILPPMMNLEAAAWEQIEVFVASGGKLITTGQLPVESVQPGSPTVEDWEEFCKKEHVHSLPSDLSMEEKIPKLLLPKLNEWVSDAAVLKLENDTLTVLQQFRIISEHQAFLFLTNQEGETLQGHVQIDLKVLLDRLETTNKEISKTEVTVRNLSLRTGEASEEIPVILSSTDPLGKEQYEMQVTLAPYEAVIFLLDVVPAKVEASSPDEVILPSRHRIELPVRGQWKVTPEQDNKLRIGEFILTVTGAQGQVHIQDLKVQTKTFIEQVAGDAGSGLPLRFDQVFGTPKKAKLAYPLRATYVSQLECKRKEQTCLLFFDQNAISGEYVIEVNQHRLCPSDFSAVCITDYNNKGADIAPYLQIGTNEITIQIEITKDHDGVVDPLMLSGSFGVYYEDGKSVLAKLPEYTDALLPEPIVGFPYYSGTYRLEQTFNYRASEGKEVDQFELLFSDFRIQDVVEVLVNGKSLGIRAWSPYFWEGSTSLLCEGDNQLEVRVTGTLIGLLEGTYFDQEQHAAVDVRTKHNESRLLLAEVQNKGRFRR